MLALVFVISLLASTLGGICGIGGGVVIKPTLDAIGFGTVSTVSFLSGSTVLAMAVISIFKNRKTNEIDVKTSVPLGLGAALGGVLGKQLFDALKAHLGSDHVVGVAQSVVLFLVVLGTLLYVRHKDHIQSKHITHKGVSLGVGLALGLCSAFLGIGGGPMNLAVLYYLFSMPTKKATVNSILIILISQTASLVLSLAVGSIPPFNPTHLIAMVVAGSVGGYISAKVHKNLSAKATEVLFQGLLVLILITCVFNVLKLM